MKDIPATKVLKTETLLIIHYQSSLTLKLTWILIN